MNPWHTTGFEVETGNHETKTWNRKQEKQIGKSTPHTTGVEVETGNHQTKSWNRKYKKKLESQDPTPQGLRLKWEIKTMLNSYGHNSEIGNSWIQHPSGFAISFHHSSFLFFPFRTWLVHKNWHKRYLQLWWSANKIFMLAEVVLSCSQEQSCRSCRNTEWAFGFFPVVGVLVSLSASDLYGAHLFASRQWVIGASKIQYIKIWKIRLWYNMDFLNLKSNNIKWYEEK